ncbi:unnamed protein product [Amoebophrya sp. A120]|nr:unnamed protein product [Amoebophrya sp. A120]|eukprot:GSA120T00002844001.1
MQTGRRPRLTLTLTRARDAGSTGRARVSYTIVQYMLANAARKAFLVCPRRDELPERHGDELIFSDIQFLRRLYESLPEVLRDKITITPARQQDGFVTLDYECNKLKSFLTTNGFLPLSCRALSVQFSGRRLASLNAQASDCDPGFIESTQPHTFDSPKISAEDLRAKKRKLNNA